MTLQLHQDFTH